MVDLPLFERVADALHGLLPDDLGTWHHRSHGRGIKVWFGGATPARLHYEAQLIPRQLVDGRHGTALEVGFHAEANAAAENHAVLEALVAAERRWRKAIGRDAVAGPFLGRPDDWCRLSETWIEPALDDPDLPIELAGRVADYAAALEPLLRARA